MCHPSAYSHTLHTYHSMTSTRLLWNFLLGLSSSRKGSIVSAMLRTWFTKPNQDFTSVRLCGVGKSEMALMYFLHGRTVSLVISKPANSTSSLANLNFSGLRVIPCLPQESGIQPVLSSIVSDHRRVLSSAFVRDG